MNALSHSKFALPLADLIKADFDYYSSCINADENDLPQPEGGSPTHDAIMSYRCTSLAEIRDKLRWMTEEGPGLDGEEEGYRTILLDLDRLLSEGKQ